jgi:pimeloyl-ACP methyl ester carboxylesterase
VLAGTLSIPGGPGRHPAVALVHGSGPALRDEGQFLTGLFLEHGIAVLAYDKRGNGESGGIYPGEFPSDSAIDTYARDAEAAVRFLSTQPELDPKRLGLFGGSQGGWIVPLAASRSTLVSFGIIQSGPTVTVGETDNFATQTAEGAAPLSKPLDQIEADVERAGPSGFDPKPWIRRLTIPVLWLYGGLDMNQPSHLDVRILQQLQSEGGHDFSWRLYPNGNHGIFEVKTGFNGELAASRGMPPAFFADVSDWLRSHALGGD